MVDFLTPCEDAGISESDLPPEQYRNLREAIDRAKPLTTQSILKKLDDINARALKIQEERTKIELHKIPTQKVKVRKKTKSIQFPVTEVSGGNKFVNAITFGMAGGPSLRTEMQTYSY